MKKNKRGLNLYLKPGAERELREGVTIINDGSRAVKIRIEKSKNLDVKETETKERECYENESNKN